MQNECLYEWVLLSTPSQFPKVRSVQFSKVQFPFGSSRAMLEIRTEGNCLIWSVDETWIHKGMRPYIGWTDKEAQKSPLIFIKNGLTVRNKQKNILSLPFFWPATVRSGKGGSDWSLWPVYRNMDSGAHWSGEQARWTTVVTNTKKWIVCVLSQPVCNFPVFNIYY